MFDWQTEDEAGAVDWSAAPLSGNQTAVWPRRRWLIGVGLVLLLGILLFGWARWQVLQTERRLRASVLATHQVALQAIRDNDVELFRSLWADTAVLPSGELALKQQFDRPFFSLYPRSVNLAETSVTLASDWQQATVQTSLPYRFMPEGGQVLPLQLRQTAVYQQAEPGQWERISLPTDDAFWGEAISLTAGPIRLWVPERDRQLAETWLPQVASALNRLCVETAVDCPEPFLVRIEWSRDPNTAYQSMFWPLARRQVDGFDFAVTFAAPTVLGLPVTPADEAVLLEQYTARAVAIMANSLAMQNGLPLETAVWLSQLDLPPQPNLSGDFLNGDLPASPEFDILLACETPNASPTLLRYDAQSGRWGVQLEGVEQLPRSVDVMQLQPLDEETAVLLGPASWDENNLTGPLFVWRTGEIGPALDNGRSFPRLMPINQLDSHPHLLTLLDIDADSLRPTWSLLDLAACRDSGECAEINLPAPPVWSPNQTQTLMVLGADPTTILLGDAQGQQRQFLVNGWDPRWIGNDQFVYVAEADADTPFSTSGTVIQRATIEQGAIVETEPLVNLADLLAKIPSGMGIADFSFTMNLIGPAGTAGDQLLVTLFIFGRRVSTQLFLVNLSTAEVKRISTGNDAPMFLERSPNGRFVSYAVEDQLLVVDVDGGETAVYDIESALAAPTRLIWSPDEQWGMIPQETAVRLISPDLSADYLLPHGFSGCWSAVWIRP